MDSVKASEASEKLDSLLEETSNNHEPVLIRGPRFNSVLVGEEDWNAVQATLHLLSVPGMRESIRDEMVTPADRCGEEPGRIDIQHRLVYQIVIGERVVKVLRMWTHYE